MDDKPDPILVKAKDLQHYVGLSRSYAYRLVKEGKFPSPVTIAAKSVAWRYSDLKAWADNLPTEKTQSE